jgi:ribosomal protein S9
LLYDQTFDFQAIGITDTKMGTRGLIGGKINHENFEKWFMDIFISSDNLLVLDTEEHEDALYYGTGLIEGETTIYGPVDNLFIDVQATTNKGTQFIIPLSDVSTVGESNLIHFVNPYEEELEDEYKKLVMMQQLKGLNLNFNLNVTKEAVAEVVIDKETGSILRGRGDGNLRLGIDMNGKFEMYGELLIDSGEYLFKSIVSKNFLVQQGGTIIWNGDPMDASINITAIHKTKANPAVILDELSSSRKIDVNLITQISGTLSEAQLDFDIEIPQASSLVASELEFKLASPDDKLTQFFSLLATGSFLNTDSRKGEFSGGSVVAGTMAEQASAILTNVLGTQSDNFEIGLDYEVAAQNKVENVDTDDQLGIMVSGRIGNKVIVNGKVGVPVGPNTQSSVVGEVEVMLPLNEAETFMGKVYNRQNEIQFDIIDSEGYTQGAGISYRFEFANAREFSEKVGLRKTEEEKLMTKEQRDSIKSSQKLLKKKESEEKKKKKNPQ